MGWSIDLFQAILQDIAIHSQYSANELERDLNHARARSTHEGFAFFSKTLPLLDDAILDGLAKGTFSCPTAFGRRQKKALPRFLGGLLSRVFCEDTGSVLPDVDVVVLNDLHQILSFFKKVEMPYAPSQERAAVLRYIENDRELIDLELPTTGALSWSLNYARSLVTELFRDFDPYDIVPHHAGGAVATGESGFGKHSIRRAYASVDACYPYPLYLSAFGSYPYRCRYEFESSAKVVLVPKDSRGPRLICSEPLEMQYFQQGLKDKMYKHIESHRLTRGFVNFSDQSINANLALSSSLDGKMGTIDLKDASDRVSLSLVQELFRDVPELLKCLLALRSTSSVLPSGELLPLAKYASMGSALCFPVEAIVFWALSKGLSHNLGRGFSTKVFVYGDDIIADSRLCPILIEHFPAFGLVPSSRKCFFTGGFRESCGTDAFMGNDITPIRLRRPLSVPTDQSIISLVATSNQLWSRCYYRASELISSFVEKSLCRRLSISSVQGSYLSWFSRVEPPVSRRKRRWNRRLHRWEERHLVTRVRNCRKTGPEDLIEQGEYLRKLAVGWSDEYSRDRWVVRHHLKLVPRWLVAN